MKKLFAFLALALLAGSVKAQTMRLWNHGQPAGYFVSASLDTLTGKDTGYFTIYTVPAGHTCAGFGWYISVLDTGTNGSTTLSFALGTNAANNNFDHAISPNVRGDGTGFVYGPSASNSMGLSGSPQFPVYATSGQALKVHVTGTPVSGTKWSIEIVFVGILL